MKFNPDLHHRRSVRLRNYDYSACGLYYVTICVQNRICMFGNVEHCGGVARNVLTEMGEIVRNEWLKTAELRPNVTLHEFVVMPNHFHGILEITEQNDGNYVLKNDDTTHDCALSDNNNVALHNVRARRALPLPATPNECTNDEQPKSRTNEMSQTRFQNIGKNTLSSIIGGFKSAVTRNIRLAGYDFAWQRNLWEHVIRDYDDYARIADYINANPANWPTDNFYCP